MYEAESNVNDDDTETQEPRRQRKKKNHANQKKKSAVKLDRARTERHENIDFERDTDEWETALKRVGEKLRQGNVSDDYESGDEALVYPKKTGQSKKTS